MEREEIVGENEETVVAPTVVRQKAVEIVCTVIYGVNKLCVVDRQSAVSSPREDVPAHDHLDTRSVLCVLNQRDVSTQYGLRICGIKIIGSHTEDRDADTESEQVNLLHKILNVSASLGHEHCRELSAGRLKLCGEIFHLRNRETKSAAILRSDKRINQNGRGKK